MHTGVALADGEDCSAHFRLRVLSISACSLQRMTPGTILNPRLFTEMLAQPSLRPRTYVLTCRNSEKLPEGRLDLEKEGECFAPLAPSQSRITLEPKEKALRVPGGNQVDGLPPVPTFWASDWVVQASQ